MSKITITAAANFHQVSIHGDRQMKVDKEKRSAAKRFERTFGYAPTEITVKHH